MTGLKMTYDVRFERGRRGKRELKEGVAPPSAPAPSRIPRVARLMALAIKMNELVRSGEIRDYAELARFGHVTRARITQIMGLINLAPDIQDQLLSLPSVAFGRDPIGERDLRPLSLIANWESQRTCWRRLIRQATTQLNSLERQP